MQADTRDTRFLQHWSRWHRLGWVPYIAWSLACDAILIFAVIYCALNLLHHGLAFADWRGLPGPDYFTLCGALAGAIVGRIRRFSSNEGRYARLTQTTASQD